MVRLRLLVAALVAAGVSGAPAALADGDPASDVLYAADVYFPYSPATAAPLRHRLVRLLRRHRAAGYPVKVALIQTPADLGAYPSLFGRPQRYARLLQSEITFGERHPHVLVVMPDGFGGRHLPRGWRRRLRDVDIARRAKADGLATAAIRAVRLLPPP